MIWGSLMALKDVFQKLGTRAIGYRPLPCWSWNDELSADEPTRQIHQMADSGLGGHVIQAGTGLITEFMGAHWIQCIKTAVAESENAGISAWLSIPDLDDEVFTSGALPQPAQEYRAKHLCWATVQPSEFKQSERTVATFLVTPARSQPLEIREVPAKAAARKAKDDVELLHFYYEPHRCVDVLDPAAVKEMIRNIHGAYQKTVGRAFGKTVPGIFHKEFHWHPVPWSAALPKFFKKARGYELLPSLPLLAYDTPESRGFRYDFWRTVTELFVDSFTRQVGEWCEKRHITFTGYLRNSGTLGGQVENSGAVMPHLAHMQVPGVQHTARRVGGPLLCKQASSVAHQFGGRRTLADTFGCSGWNVSFEELRWIADWHFAQGVDLICPHLSLYSAGGCRKRACPPSLHYQQPWWGDYKLLTDYFARVSFMLTRGKHVADVLLLHNVESAWASIGPKAQEAVSKLDAKLGAIAEALLGAHIDFDFGDETILAGHARVSSGRLRVKSAEYRIVVVPPCTTLRSTTLQVLERFMKGGGTVILAGSPPKLMDGRADERPAEVLAAAVRTAHDTDSLRAAVRKALEPRITVVDEDGEDAVQIYVQQRDAGLEQVYFLANIGRDSVAATVRLPGTGRLERWDAETGGIEPLRTQKRGKHLETALDFEPMGSHLLVLHKRRKPATVRARKTRPIATMELGDVWSVQRTEPNVLALDTCSYRIADGAWSPLLNVLKVQDYLKHIAASQVCEFKYSFTADFSTRRPESVHLIVESPAAYDVILNGLPVLADQQQGGQAELGWWRDIAFHRLDVSQLLNPQARNDVVLRRVITGEAERLRLMTQPETGPEERNRLRYGQEIEPVYILGDFLVRSQAPFQDVDRGAVRTRGRFVLADDWTQSTTGDLVEQGLPFYAGGVRLSQTVNVPEKALRSAAGATLTFDPPNAITARVILNKKSLPARGWRPYEFEIGDLLSPGRNEVQVELTGSCRNLLGPHHNVNGELHAVGPESFRGLGSWTGEKGSPENTWDDSYTFTRFGLAGPVTITLWK